MFIENGKNKIFYENSAVFIKSDYGPVLCYKTFYNCEAHQVLQSRKGFLALHINIRLVWKGLTDPYTTLL
jgi:hypothetical protein